MNWNDLRFFIAAAETGSLAAAARTLHSNQPTVGRRIEALETSLNTRLFKRHTNGLTLTEEGSAILAQAQTVELNILSLEQALGEESKAIEGTVRIAIPEGLCNEVLIYEIKKLMDTYPSLKIILNVSKRTANLTRGEADIAIRIFRPAQNDLVVKQLGEMTLGLYASHDYLEKHACPTRLKELKAHKVITFGEQLFDIEENKWLLQHTQASNNLLSTDNLLARIRATEAGIGISIQPKMFACQYPSLHQIMTNISLPSHPIWLAYHKDIRNTQRIRVVVDFICQVFAEQSSSQ